MKKYRYNLTQIFITSLIVSSLLIFDSTQIYAQNIPRVFINEILSSNLSTNPDMVDFDDFSDWIELYNDEDTDVNIGGYYLTDDLTQPMKWQFPPNIVIPAKGFFLVWADGYNDVPGKTYTRNWWPYNIRFTTKWCHTNFKLNANGDKIALFDSANNLIDSVSFSEQLTDVSYGRKPDGSNYLYYFGEPTPLSSNKSISYNSKNFSGEVIFSSDGGFYQSPIQVTLSSSSKSGIIRYTTDGSKPTSSSKLYTVPITIDKNTVIRARVFENSKLPGKIITNSYFINETRNLPAVSLITEPAFLWDKQLGIYLNSYKEREIPISLEYFPLNSTRAFVLDAGARIGGENIFRFAQKPFNIYARSDYGSPHINYKIFDEFPYKEFKQLYLRNSGDDWRYTMFRDGMLINLFKNRISNAMQAFKPSVLYLNGQYWGIYNVREKIDEQYFLLHYNVDPSDLDHINDDNTVISGDSTDFVNLLNFAKNNDLSNSSNYDYVTSKIDIHELMDFVITQDYIANSSWAHNREMWRDKKKQKLWHWIVVDMDRGFDANRITANQLDDLYNNFDLFRRLCANENFKNEFVQRYAEHLNHTFNYDRVVKIIDSLKSIIQNEMPRHIQKWGNYIDSLTIDIWGKTPGITSLDYWNSEIQKLKKFAEQRAVYAVQYLSSKFNLSGRANLKISSNVQNQGKVNINNFYHNFGETNLYFKNIPLTITAYPPPGYKFKQWKVMNSSTIINLIPSNSQWKYRDESSAPDASWKNLDYNDSNWKIGNAQFGYGDGDEKTIINFGPNSQNKYITSYYRHTFQITNLADIKELKLKLLRDDGAVVYLNGNEIIRSNMPSGTITFSTTAINAVGDAEESTYFEFTIDKANLLAGKNVIAVEIHQANSTSSDVSFDLSLDAILNQSTSIENILSAEQSINYTITNDTELIAEFENLGSVIIPQTINEPITLTKTNSPYFITQDVTINENGVLTVEPGVTIYFSSGKGIYVKGILLMLGTSSEPIILTSYYENEKWGAICFDNSKETSELKFVNISNATNGNDTVNFFAAISSLNSSVRLTNVNFDNVKLPISSQWSDMTIDSCIFQNVTGVGDYINCNGGNIRILNSFFKGNKLSDMDAIDLGFNTGITEIINNTIIDFTGSNSDGIDLGDESKNVLIEGNIIINCHDKGVSIGQGSNAILKRNAISKCDIGVGLKDSQSFADIINCTFYLNNIGVACYEKNANRGGGSANVLNSIFANSIASSFIVDEYGKININYSLSNTDILPGNENLFDEPLMINPDGGNFHIQFDSPCIDKGDPLSGNDIDGSRADIGAFIFSGVSEPVIVINEINYNSSKDFDSEDWIELYNNSGKTINLSYWVFMDENRKPSFVINPGLELKSNSYLVLCRDDSLFKSKYPEVYNYQGNLNYGLSGSGESLYLYDNLGRLVDSLTYRDKSPWPVEADGNGSSLELKNPSLDNSLGINWSASVNHGTPGKINSTYITSVEQITNNLIPVDYSLSQNYPNPFNPVTNIKISIPELSYVRLAVYDILGRRISVMAEGNFQSGIYSVKWDGGEFPSGIYFLQMNAQSKISNKKFISVRKLVLLK